VTWLNRILNRDKLETQLDKELRDHVERHAADLIDQGLSPDEARRRARLELGGPEQVKEECRDARGTRWLEDLWQDVRYALRTLRQKPGFATVALLTLALGIGATTVMFTVVNGVILKPLPYADPGHLIAIYGHSADWNDALYGEQHLSRPDFLDIKQASKTLDLAAAVANSGTMSEPGDPVYALTFEISDNIFSVLGVPVFLGRSFTADEDRPGGTPVVILGYTRWVHNFGGNKAVLGTSLVFDTKRYTIVGVAAPTFRIDGNEPDLMTPLNQDTAAYLQNRRAHPVRPYGRLAPRATLAQAQAELAVIGPRLAAQYPKTNATRGFKASILQVDVSDVRSTLWLLLGAVSLVLLIACTNIGNLLLARAVSRERELAMRVALGAGRGRLIRQCLTESAVLGLGGGAFGIALAALGLQPFVKLWPGVLPREEEVLLDWRVLLFALAVSLFSGILFGLAPALRAPARSLEQKLRSGARSVAVNSRWLHGVFVVAEIALAVVLLVSAGMLGKTMLELSELNPGVNIHNVLAARTALSPSVFKNPEQARAAWEDILTRARRVPGVEAAAIVDTVPMAQGNNAQGYGTSAAEVPENQKPLMLPTCATPDYLKVMGIPLRKGRFLDEHDRKGSQTVAVIDEVMAQQAFPGQDPIGKHLWIGLEGDPVTVVGVVGHVRYWGPAGDDQAKVRSQLYYPFAQVPDALVARWSQFMSVTLKTSVDPLTLLSALKKEVRGSASDQVLYRVRTMEQLAGDSLARQRFLLLLFGIFGGLALLLACIGIYGVLAYLTGQRVPEIGVRLALGASRGEVMWMVLRDSLGMVLVGVVVGGAAAFGAARLLIRSVEGMRSTEPVTFALMITVLIAAALIASFVPARRASLVDPMRALRQE
jgi:predicted permease